MTSVLIAPLITFVMVLTRLSGLFMTAPIYGSRSVPVKIRAMLAVAMSMVITPLYVPSAASVPDNVAVLVSQMVREAILGLSLGLAVLILFAGLQLAGFIMGQMSGMQLADVFNPGVDTSVPVFSQLLDLVTLTVFVIIGGHLQVMEALLDTFHWMPPGEGRLNADGVAALMDIMTNSFEVGIRAAAPVMMALLMSILVLGLISRTLPQLNILAVGFNLNALILLLFLALGLGSAATLFQDYVPAALELFQEALLQDRGAAIP